MTLATSNLPETLRNEFKIYVDTDYRRTQELKLRKYVALAR